jgi:hypothetical protein
MWALKSYSTKLSLQTGAGNVAILEVDSEKKVTKTCSYFKMTLIPLDAEKMHGCLQTIHTSKQLYLQIQNVCCVCRVRGCVLE